MRNIIDPIKSMILFDKTTLPSMREWSDYAEQIIIRENPAAANEDLSKRGQVLAGMAWEEIVAELAMHDELHGAPLPTEESLNDKLNHEDEDIREGFQDLYEAFEEESQDSTLSIPFRVYYQRHLALLFASGLGDSGAMVLASEFLSPYDMEEAIFSFNEFGTLLSISDEDGNELPAGVIGDIYECFVLPLRDLGQRIIETDLIETDGEEDFAELEGVVTVEDFLGES